jgi:hypothetical protein
MKLNINDKAIKNKTTKYINNIIDDVEKPYIYRNKKYDNYPFSVIKKSTNKKIGKKVLKGLKKDYPIYTITLVERKTCSDECEHWLTCYGNNMMYAIRFNPYNKNFLPRLESDLKTIANEPKNKNGFLLRLHVLGDFYSKDYVLFWKRMLKLYPNLNIYGYTRNHNNSKYLEKRNIANEIIKLNTLFSTRFYIRFSNKLDIEESANSIDLGKKGITCLAQVDDKKTCATCTLCWTSKKPINFITH